MVTKVGGTTRVGSRLGEAEVSGHSLVGVVAGVAEQDGVLSHLVVHRVDAATGSDGVRGYGGRDRRKPRGRR